MKKAFVLYSQKGDTITIENWGGIAKKASLPEKYKKDEVWFCESDDGKCIELWSNRMPGVPTLDATLKIGTKMKSFTYVDMMRLMRQCGDRLSEILRIASLKRDEI